MHSAAARFLRWSHSPLMCVNDTAIENGKTRVNPVESCANVRSILRGAKQYTVLMVGQDGAYYRFVA